MPQPEVRVVGSGFTALYYDAQPIAWLERFVDSGQRTLEQPEAVYQLDLNRPKEIVTGYTLQQGSITATIRETWNEEVWERLAGLRGADNILDVYERLRQRPDRVTCQRVIRPPNNGPVRGKVYHGVVVTAIPDGETVNIGALSVAKDIQMAYTHTTPLKTAPAV